MSQKNIAAAEKAVAEAEAEVAKALATLDAAKANAAEVQAANTPRPSQARRMISGEVVKDDKEFQKARKV